mmetsp:Transcript_29607/g.69281  ORF Transcript_29607/g.69281 Transcript_29607/m.69281 type:complete len:297 (-) Transcript_29607:190-1080(-)
MNSEPKQARAKGQKWFDFQLFDVPRLEELRAKETAAQEQKSAARKGKEKEEEDEAPDESAGLTRAEELEKAELLRAGFAEWTRKDFNAFVRGCELHGRTSLRRIAEEMEGKNEHEVSKYSSQFWRKHEQIESGDKAVRRIEVGEQRITRRVEIGAALATKVTRHKNSWQALKILYGAQKGKLFSEEEDRFLVCMTHHLGYGQWDQLREEVRKAWLFRFDWFIKTRSVQELQRRVDLLIRLIEKENAEIAEAEAEAARKAKKEAAKKSAAGQKGSQPTAAKRKSDAGAGGSAAKKKR